MTDVEGKYQTETFTTEGKILATASRKRMGDRFERQDQEIFRQDTVQKSPQSQRL